MSKDKMILDLMHRTRVIFWGGLIMGVVSVGILSYAAVRYLSSETQLVMGLDNVLILKSVYCLTFRSWNKWKLWTRQREPPQTPNQPVVNDETEDADEIPDGQLCVICVTRRRIPAFIPCGHIVCCRQCALTVERGLNPKCPVCLQSIRGSMRVYYSWWIFSRLCIW